ncbi:dTDP-4-dehydrorhamnose 3,5-epimerase [Pseudomonas amygdali pv. morsprunorum]|nr:dTDP-4-dehydrorhamnose 3,5-epimerase [Pseudomonas amygdali pv. morsprunorum]
MLSTAWGGRATGLVMQVYRQVVERLALAFECAQWQRACSGCRRLRVVILSLRLLNYHLTIIVKLKLRRSQGGIVYAIVRGRFVCYFSEVKVESIKLAIPDVILFAPKVFGDERGFFYESFNQQVFDSAVNRKVNFVQDNHSKSAGGVVRGMHYQIQNPQGKLVRVIKGEVFDVAVDLRKDSPFFGKWVGEYLSEENKKQLWVPEGFAHGFIVLSDSAEFLYKTTNYYDPKSERSLRWDDADIGIQWPALSTQPTLSVKDQNALPFSQLEYFEDSSLLPCEKVLKQQ